MKLLDKIKSLPFNYIIIGIVVILAISIMFMTCREKKQPVILHPTKAEIEAAAKAKKEHELFINSTNSTIARLEGERDSISNIIKRKDAEIEVKSLRITSLTRQATLAKKYKDTLLFNTTCDSLLPQVDDLIATVDQLQIDNRNVQDAYDSLYGVANLKIARMEYDYSVLQERFDKVSSNAIQFETSSNKQKKKADKRLIFGLQTGTTYSFPKGRVVPYAGAGFTYRIARF